MNKFSFVPLRGRLEPGLLHTLRSLKDRNYRLFFFGQVVSLTGSWMENLALGLVIYGLTGSAAALGIVAALTQFPTIILGYKGGALSDRINPRSILLATQTLSTLLAIVLLLFALTNALSLEIIYALALLMGIAQAVDVPARQVLLPSLVRDEENLANAVVLNSTLFNLSRLVGPLLAVAAIAYLGVAGCFAINAVSFLFSLFTLLAIKPRPRKLEAKNGQVKRDSPSFRGVLGKIRASRELSALMLMAAVTGLFTFQYLVLLPAFTAESFFPNMDPASIALCSADHAPADPDACGSYSKLLGMLTACSAGGALVGSLLAARVNDRTSLLKGISYTGFSAGIALLMLSTAYQPWQAALSIFLVGLALTACLVSNQAIRQLVVEDKYRGRILSIFLIATLGLMAVGNLAMGRLASFTGVDTTYRICALFTVAGAILYYRRKPWAKGGS
ncbi:MFS transporter [bacterium]|nr:MFS transporter [bacterium]